MTRVEELASLAADLIPAAPSVAPLQVAPQVRAGTSVGKSAGDIRADAE